MAGTSITALQTRGIVSMKNGVVSQVNHGPFIQTSAWVSPASIPNSSNLFFLFPDTTLCKTYIAPIKIRNTCMIA